MPTVDELIRQMEADVAQRRRRPKESVDDLINQMRQEVAPQRPAQQPIQPQEPQVFRLPEGQRQALAPPEEPDREDKSTFFRGLSEGFSGGSLNVAAGLIGTFGELLKPTKRLDTSSYYSFISSAALKDSKDLKQLSAKVNAFADELYRTGEQFAPEAGAGAGDFVGRAIGQAIPYMTASVAASIATGNPAAAFGVAFAVEGDNAYRNAIKGGATEDEANTERIIVGTLNGAIEQLQVGGIFKFAKKAKEPAKLLLRAAKDKALKKIAAAGGKLSLVILKHAAQEGLEEAIQENVSMFVPAVHGREVPTGKEALFRTGQAALGGAVVGGFLGGAGAIKTTATDLVKTNPELAENIASKENPSRTDVEALGIKLNAQERTELSGALKTALEQPTEKPIVPVSEPVRPVELEKEQVPVEAPIAPKAVEAKPEAVELTDQGPIGVWEEGVLLEDTPKELAKVITEVRKNEGDAAAKIVKRLQDAGIDTTSTHFNEETGEITVRAMNISDENKAILEKRGVTITQFPPMKGDYLIFKPTPTAKPKAVTGEVDKAEIKQAEEAFIALTKAPTPVKDRLKISSMQILREQHRSKILSDSEYVAQLDKLTGRVQTVPPSVIEKEIEDGKETIIEPATSLEVDQRKAGRPIPEATGKLNPTDPKEALEITERHAQWVAFGKEPSIGGIFSTKWDKDRREHVVDKVEYTSEQVDAAYRTIQKPVPSTMPDTNLFAMPGQEAKLQAIATKMQRQKKFTGKKKGIKTTKPRALPKAKTTKEDHIKAVWVASAPESTRYALNGVWVEGDTIVATDGHRMFWAKGKWGKDGLYTNTAKLKDGLLGKIDKDAGNFPKWRDIVPETNKEDKIEVFDLDRVWRHVHQASLIMSEDSKGLTVLVNTNGELGFASASPEIGHSEVNVYPGAKILGGINPNYLLDTIKFHAIRGDTGFNLYFPDHNRPMLTKSFDGKTSTIIMPVNIDIEPSEALAAEMGKPIAKGKKPKGAEIGFVSDPTVVSKGKGEAGFVGIEGRPGGVVGKPWLTTDKTESPDSDIEDFFGRTKKLPGKLNLQAAMERVKFILRGAFTTQTPHLETTPETAYIRDIIRTMPEQQRAARENAIKDILAIMENDGSVKALDRAGLDLLRRKVFVQDLLSEAEIDRSVSGDLSLEQLKAENARLDDLIDQVPSVKKAFEARQKLWKDVSDDLFKRGVLDEESRDNVSYVRHFVIDYINNNRRPVAAKRKKLAEPYRAYKKQRKGSRKDISTDYLAVEVRALADIYADNVIEDIANDIAIKEDRRREFKKIAKDKNLSLQEVAEREGYVEWHYKRPNLFYRAQTLDRAKIAALLEENAVDAGDTIQIPKSMMYMSLVLGKRAGWYIPEELAMQLDDLPVNYRGHPIIEGMAAFSKASIQFWKRWILRVNPLRYNARNQLGDTERVIASGQEAALKRIPQALKILITKEGEYYGPAKEYGVIGSSLWHEMGNVSKLKEFEKFKDFTEKKTFKSYTANILMSPLRLASRIGTVEQDLTQMREDILRLAVYIENLEKMRAGKKIRHWAGQRADIEAIAKESKERAAAKMSRETLIDYGSFTIFEDKVLRNGILPFYSFFKRNLTFWPRAFVKATQEGTAGKTVASALPRVTFNMAMWLMRIMAGYAAAWMWNHKDEESKKKEESMPFWLRSQPHLNIGEKTLWGNTALSDFGEWGDVAGLQSVSWRHEAGFIDQKQAAMEAAIVIGEAPVNKIAQAINPFIKATGTAIYGQSVYPDVFDPRYVKGNKYKRAILDVLGTDAMKFYESTTGKRRLEDTLYAYFAGWWMRPNDPETIIKQIMSTEAWSSLKRKSPTTGRGKGKAKSGREAQWQEAKIRQHLKIPQSSK